MIRYNLQHPRNGNRLVTSFSPLPGYYVLPRVDVYHGRRGEIRGVWLLANRYPEIVGGIWFHRNRGQLQCYHQDSSGDNGDGLPQCYARELYAMFKAVITKGLPIEPVLDRLIDLFPESEPAVMEIVHGRSTP